MLTESTISFDELVVYRQQLQKFCANHFSSLIAFRDGISFKLNLGEATLGGKARHFSSSVTCIHSLMGIPNKWLPRGAEPSIFARDFADSAIQHAPGDWLSDGSAAIYCKCRTLPIVVSYLTQYHREIEQHLEAILTQLQHDDSRLAIGEASGDTTDRENWYPPNAYHTYWTLHLLQVIEDRFPLEFAQICATFAQTRYRPNRLRAEMLTWAQQILGQQIALHASESATLDSDQLAWALVIVVTFYRDFQANLTQQDFIRYGLKCFFEHQTSIGIWRTGAPLFHYKNSGNAYCYIFETITVLLESVLTERKEGIFLRQVLRPYVNNLLGLWKYAKATEIPLFENEDGKIGWSSGHRPNRKLPESWATASVFSFSQCLRRLVGIWTREWASEKLKISPSHGSPIEAVQTLVERGDTWAPARVTVGSQLMTLFVNPVRYYESGKNLDPDSEAINENQARAAILFGPPGTSKTTLSRSVADAIGWDYIELHASHFVADGLPNVQRTADTIFEKLLQLDRTVILFDEIDELVRAREKEPDAFGRFLTTSMLPKLAELWKRRKVIYFVATNHITFFDPAVTRAQRFDALVNVSPPSFERKIERLKEILASSFKMVVSTGLNASQVENALKKAVRDGNDGVVETPDAGDLLPPSCMMAKLLLMRWDQLQELASIILRQQSGRRKGSLVLDQKLLKQALSLILDPSLRRCQPYRDYVDSAKYEQHDFSKVNIWEVKGDILDEHKLLFSMKSDVYWHVSRAAFGDFSDLPCRCTIAAPGVLDVGAFWSASELKRG